MGRMREEARREARGGRQAHSPSSQRALRRRLIAAAEAVAPTAGEQSLATASESVQTPLLCQEQLHVTNAQESAPEPRPHLQTVVSQALELENQVPVMGTPLSLGVGDECYPRLSACRFLQLNPQEFYQGPVESSLQQHSQTQNVAGTVLLQAGIGVSRGGGVQTRSTVPLQSHTPIAVGTTPLQARTTVTRGGGVQTQSARQRQSQTPIALEVTPPQSVIAVTRGGGVRSRRHGGQRTAECQEGQEARLVGMGSGDDTPLQGTAVRSSGASRGRGRCRGQNRRRGGRSGFSQRQGVLTQPIQQRPAPAGWTPPGIVVAQRSPVLLRSRTSTADLSRNQLALSRTSAVLPEDEDIINMPALQDRTAGEDGFSTPPRERRPQHRNTQDSMTDTVPPAHTECGFALTDFMPGPPSPDTLARQMLQAYQPWLHDCGNTFCLFTQEAKVVRGKAIAEGRSEEAILASCNQLPVDSGPWTNAMYVRVRLLALGYDSAKWGDLTHFRGRVTARFYQRVSGQPMFTIDFGGSIGILHHRVQDTELDLTDLHMFGNVAQASQRPLHIGECSTQHPGGDGSAGEAEEAHAAEQQSLSDPSDVDWRGDYEDFNDGSSQNVPSSPEGSFHEMPMSELGFYDNSEELLDWSFEETWADNQWQEPNFALLDDREFIGPLPGATGRLRLLPAAPMEYFMKFWPAQTLHRIIKETNRYAKQADIKYPHLTNGRQDWVDLNQEELLCWFGVLVLMGLKVVPNRRLYWDIRSFYSCPIITSVMSRLRFEAIICCVHLVDNDQLVNDVTDPRHDKIGKVRALIETFAQVSQSLYNNEAICTVDEIMVPYKGRYCGIRQYMKSKPVRFGIKIWALVSSKSRYVSNVMVYMGASTEGEAGALVGENAVLQVVRGLEHRGHTIITDNFFTGVKLFMRLLERGFYATGTVKKGSRGFPHSLAGFAKSDLPPRGTLIVKMHRCRRISAICWIDSKPVWLLSTATDPVQAGAVAGRWIRRDRVNFPTSPILLEYQKNMRGVDVVDQQQRNYTAQLQSMKWWHRILLFVLDSSCLNAYVLYREDAVRVGLQVQARLQWHYELAMALVCPHLQGGLGRPGPHRTLTRPGFHRIEGHPTHRRLCVVCSRRTRRFCGGCGCTFMCAGACYVTAHTQGFRMHGRRRA